MATSIQVVMDCHDPDRLARFWATALHYKLQDPPEGYASWEQWLSAMSIPREQWNDASAVVDPDKHGPRIYFQRVPEPKTVKNRVHLDLNVGGGPGTALEVRRERVDVEVERLVEAGATKTRAVNERGEYWVVMADPEGNEFCVQ
jgi:hypothetical protein